MQAAIIVPARMASIRLPRKMLLSETGKPLLQHTYEAALSARRASGVCVAADGEEIAAAVRAFGGNVRLTDPACESGTDRIAQVAATLPDEQIREADIIVNLQGDEPDMPGAAIDAAIELLANNPQAPMATIATPIRTRERLLDPACVKVVCDKAGRALYFSRSPIPAVRDWDDALLEANPPYFLMHLGVYAYRREFLLSLSKLPRCAAERLESLEQLRVLDAGHSILVATVDAENARGIDTPEDYRAFVERTRAKQQAAA